AGQATAYGAKDFGPGLRAFLVAAPAAGAGCEGGAEGAVERVWVLETHVDHLNGEDLGACFEPLFEAGALDVFFAPGVMKKNRPGGALTVLCPEAGLAAVERAMFAATLTLGVRRTLTERVALPRRAVVVATPFGPVEAKEAVVDGMRLVSPEYDSLVRLAAANGRSVAAMRRLVAAFLDNAATDTASPQ
ncbi:MAG: nickel insertion protein, partial [Desulfovibrionaceae bacterium]